MEARFYGGPFGQAAKEDSRVQRCTVAFKRVRQMEHLGRASKHGD